MKYYIFPTDQAAAILTKVMTSHRLFQSQASYVYQHIAENVHLPSVVLCNFDPEYSVEEINLAIFNS